METRANFILIGAFTLAAILGSLGFLLWLASVQLDRQYATYGILFGDVSGLSPSGDVQFHGISVGKVIDLHIHRPDPSQVFATIEIDATTPVRADTVAQLTSQGVTGVAYIALSGTTSDAPPLAARAGEIPIIPSRRSTVQALVEDAPDLLDQAGELLAQLRALTGPANQVFVASILSNLQASSQRLDQALTDFSEITATVADATVQVTRFTDRLDSIGTAVETTLTRGDKTLQAADGAFRAAERALDSSEAVIANAAGAFDAAETVLRADVPELLARLTGAIDGVERTVGTIDAAVGDIQGRSGRTLDGFAETATLLNARLAEVQNTLAAADAALAGVGRAADSAEQLVSGPGTETLAELRARIAEVAGRLDLLSGAATATLARIDTTLASADGAIAAAEGALVATGDAAGSAGAAFDAARGLLEREVPAVLGDVSTAVQGVEAAVGDLRGRSARALDGFAGTAELLNARLAELERTLLDAGTAFAAVTEASDSFDLLVDGDGTLMVAEARAVLGDAATAIAAVQGVLVRDVPEVLGDIRGAVATADAAVGRIADEVSGAVGGLDPLMAEAERTLGAASALFARSQSSLGALDRALTGAETTLGAASRTFDAATGVLESDLDPVLADLRAASGRIADAVDQVAADVPPIAADLRALIARSDAVVAEVQRAVAAAAPGIGDFARTGLPELSRLGSEARRLVGALDSVVRRIERDPAKFLLGDRVPDYRR